MVSVFFLTNSLSLPPPSLPLTHPPTHSLSLSLPHTHTHTHTHPPSLSLSHVSTVPSDSPTILRAISLSSYSIYISWSSPTIPNGLIRRYHINIIEQNTHTSWQIITINQYIEIVRLHPYYIYSITVAAVTIDEGPYSHSVDVVTYQDSEYCPINEYCGISLIRTTLGQVS